MSITLCLVSTATGKAADKGASATVNGYMAFLLFSVAGLACESLKRAPLHAPPDLPRLSSHPLHRIDDIHGYPSLCWRIREGWFPRDDKRCLYFLV